MSPSLLINLVFLLFCIACFGAVCVTEALFDNKPGEYCLEWPNVEKQKTPVAAKKRVLYLQLQ